MLEQRHRYSLRLRRQNDEVKEYRRSGENVVNADKSEDVFTDTKVDTLDPVVGGAGIQRNLRPLLRNMYMKYPTTESENINHKTRGRPMHSSEVRIKDFGLIDNLPDEAQSRLEYSR